MPFISLAGDFSQIHNNEYYKTAYEVLGFTKETDFVISFGIVLIFFYIFRSGINMTEQ